MKPWFNLVTAHCSVSTRKSAYGSAWIIVVAAALLYGLYGCTEPAAVVLRVLSA